MTPVNFNNLCNDIRGVWTKRDGAVAIMTSPGRKKELRICVSGQSNELRAYTCVVWRGSDIVYNGVMQDASLRELLTSEGVCRGAVTRAGDLEEGVVKRGACYGTGNGDSCRKCRAVRRDA